MGCNRYALNNFILKILQTGITIHQHSTMTNYIR